MPKMLRTFVDFTGGLSEASPDLIRDNELREACNAEPDERGGLRKIKGYQVYYDHNHRETDLVRRSILYTPEDSESSSIILFTTGGVYEFEKKWENDTPLADRYIPYEGKTPRAWNMFNGKLHWLDGEELWVYDGTEITKIERPEETDEETWDFIRTCDFMVQRGQRHFYAKKTSDLMYFSEVGFPQQVKATNVVKVVTEDGDKITGLKEFGGALLVFKSRSIFGWYGWDITTDVVFKRLPVSEGAISNATIVEGDNVLYYLGRNGVYMLNSPYPDQMTVTNITEGKIGQRLAKFQEKELAQAVYFDGCYRLALKEQDSVCNNLEYRFYPRLSEDGSWFGPHDIPVSQYLYKPDENALYTTTIISPGVCVQDNSYLFNERPIKFKVRTKPLDIVGAVVRPSKVKRLYIATRQYTSYRSSYRLKIKVDYNEREFDIYGADESGIWNRSIWGEFLWGWVDLVTKEISLSMKGLRAEVTIINENPGETMTLYGIGMLYKPRKARGTRTGIKEVL